MIEIAQEKLAPLVTILCEKISQLNSGDRYMLGIVGYPGAGKSTTAQALVSAVNRRSQNQSSIAVPMDGFHFSNSKLKEIGLLPLKGIPDTFDATAFVQLLKELKSTTQKNVYCPLFERGSESSIANAIVIEPKHTLCIVEGNYLLLQKKPWNECKTFLDEIWFIDLPVEVTVPRLIDRHVKGGKTLAGAKAKVDSTDLPNARLIEETKKFADRLISL